MKIGFLHSIIRVEEKLLLTALKKRNHEIVLIDDRETFLHIGKNNPDYDIVLERCINHTRALFMLKILNDSGIKTVNTYQAADICGNKLLTSMALETHNIPTPKSYVAFTPESAIQAIETLGYPCVLKPMIGSWGRLISKVNDRETAESILEHKSILGHYQHSIFYIQEYINKPKKYDIRSFVIGNECIAAISRTSDHWITNTARGAKAENYPLNQDLCDISIRAAHACGGGILAIDLFETDSGYLVNEVNYTMEFKNSIHTTGINIPERIVDYLEEVSHV